MAAEPDDSKINELPPNMRQFVIAMRGRDATQMKKLKYVRKMRLAFERLEFGRYEIIPVEELMEKLLQANQPHGQRTTRIVYVMEWQGYDEFFKYDKRYIKEGVQTYYKIGEAESPGKRMRQIKDNPSVITIYTKIRHKIRVEDTRSEVARYSEPARYIEHVLHYIFGHKRVLYPSWEYFDLDESDLTWLKQLRYIDAGKLCSSIQEDHRMQIRLNKKFA